MDFNNFIFFINQPMLLPSPKSAKKEDILKYLHIFYKKGFDTVMNLLDMDIFVYCPSYSLVLLLIAKFDGNNIPIINLLWTRQNRLVYQIMKPKIVMLCSSDWRQSELCQELVKNATADQIPCLELEAFLRGTEKSVG